MQGQGDAVHLDLPRFWWDEDWKGKAGWWYQIRTDQDIHVEKQYC